MPKPKYPRVYAVHADGSETLVAADRFRIVLADDKTVELSLHPDDRKSVRLVSPCADDETTHLAAHPGAANLLSIELVKPSRKLLRTPI